MKVTDVVETPNPNAMKVLLDGVIAEQTRSYFNAGMAKGDALAEALFAVPGVKGVMLLGNFVTISKEAGVAWPGILGAVRGVLEGDGGK